MMKNTETKNRISANALRIIFALSVFAAGTYYELFSALLSIALLVLLLWRGGPVRCRTSLSLAAALLISLFYFIASVWAVDSAMALWGGVKYLPVLLWALCFSAAENDSQEELLSDLPLIGAVNTVLSFVLLFIPSLTDSFVVGGRLAGFFFYPNTFACFLLLGMQVLLFPKVSRYGRLKPALFAVLAFGLYMSASRAVLGLAIVTLPFGAYIACKKEAEGAKPVIKVLAFIAIGVAAGLAASQLPGFRTTSHVAAGGGSTLYGRLLYWKDAALPILKNPFGMGYLGYYMSQASFQTGIYSVRWAHNELVQILLDIGWIPAIVLVVAIVKSLLSKKLEPGRKLLLLTLCAHSLFDFNFEFLAMYGLLFALLEYDSPKQKKLPRLPAIVAGVLLSLFSLYIGVASTLTYTGKLEAAASIYKGNTLAENMLIHDITDRSELESLADSILARNKHVSSAWDAKALCYYSSGDFGSFITAKEKAITENPYALDRYEDYYLRLAMGVELYSQAGDSSSAEYCLERIHGISNMLSELREKTSSLAYKTIDAPDFTLSDDYYSYLKAHPLS